MEDADDKFSDEEERLEDPFYDASDELEDYIERDPIVIQLKDGSKVEIPNNTPREKKRERRHRQMRSRGQRTMPEFRNKSHYLVGVKANDCVKDKVTGCYLTQVIRTNNKKKSPKSNKTEGTKQAEEQTREKQKTEEKELTKVERKAKYNELK